MHPDKLLESVTAEQIADWWFVYLTRPWGDDRADMRAAATLAVFNACEGWSVLWPYCNTESADDVRAEFEMLERFFDDHSGID